MVTKDEVREAEGVASEAQPGVPPPAVSPGAVTETPGVEKKEPASDGYRLPSSDAEWQLLWDNETAKQRLERETQARSDRLISRERQKWVLEQAQRQQALKEQQRLDDMDAEELGTYVREHQKLSQELDTRMNVELQKVFEGSIASLMEIPKSLKLTSGETEEFHKVLNSANSFSEMIGRATEFLTDHRAKALAEPVANKRAQALYEERLAKEREKEEGPDVTRAAHGGSADDLKTVKGITQAVHKGRLSSEDASARLRALSSGDSF